MSSRIRWMAAQRISTYLRPCRREAFKAVVDVDVAALRKAEGALQKFVRCSPRLFVDLLNFFVGLELRDRLFVTAARLQQQSSNHESAVSLPSSASCSNAEGIRVQLLKTWATLWLRSMSKYSGTSQPRLRSSTA